MEGLLKSLKLWVDHPKLGSGRTQLDENDLLWNYWINKFIELDNSEDKELKQYASYLLYKGTLKRIHMGHDKVDIHNHYVSWTVTDNLDNLYWFNSDLPHTIITARATKENPALSVFGFINAMKKFEDRNFELNSPAMRQEQEVIFPLNKNSILKIEQFN